MRRVFALFAMSALPVLINVYPVNEVYRRPSYKTITVTILKNVDNRKLVISWQSDTGLSGSTEYQLDDKSPHKFQRQIEVSPGEYIIRACLHTSLEVKCVSQPALVIGETYD